MGQSACLRPQAPGAKMPNLKIWCTILRVKSVLLIGRQLLNAAYQKPMSVIGIAHLKMQNPFSNRRNGKESKAEKDDSISS